ncbi:MAG: DUF3072 domain-containing protein [Ornithinimicrobium sp.]
MAETSTDSGDEQDMLGAPTPQTNDQLDKDPSDWVTGQEPMTASQRSYLDTLASEAGEQIPADLSKAQASEHIDRLQQKSGRGDAT